MILEQIALSNLMCKTCLLPRHKIQAVPSWHYQVTQGAIDLKLSFLDQQLSLISEGLYFPPVLPKLINNLQSIKWADQNISYWKTNLKKGNVLISKFLKIKFEQILVTQMKSLDFIFINLKLLYCKIKNYSSYFKKLIISNNFTYLDKLLKFSSFQ